jgi:metallo-beta-lactamase family protein
MESVYGDRNHEPKSERIEKLQSIIEDIIRKKGTLVIPAFSLERTQVLIYEMNNLFENKVIKSIPVYIDSPLATKITEVYKDGQELFNEKTKEQIRNGDDIFSFKGLTYTHSSEDSKALERVPGPKIIIAGSGMSVGGRVIRHEEIYLPDPNSTILLVGYQTLGTIGRHLLDGDKKIVIHRNTIKVKAKIESILGYSSHKDSDHLVELVSQASDTLKKAFVVMGEYKSATFLSQRIKDELNINTVCPEIDKPYLLD